MFHYPAATLFNRPITKSKILERSKATTRIKNLLTHQVQHIVWHAKLAPETLFIPATIHVPEIQIFRLILKSSVIEPRLLDYLDNAIPQPILWTLVTPDHQIAHSAAHKRPSEADAGRWVTGPRFTSSFLPQPSSMTPLPTALDLGHLYSALLAPLLPLAARRGETLPALIERCSQHQSLQRKIAQLTTKVHREKQFNRRVAFNQELNSLLVTLVVLEHCDKFLHGDSRLSEQT